MATIPEQLETLVDDHGLDTVLAGLTTVCGLKMEWVEKNWGAPINADNRLGLAWGTLYVDLGKVYKRIAPVSRRLQGLE